MHIFESKQEVTNFITNLKIQGKRIAFVPTMGALHDGHLSLIKIAKQNADIVIASIFVNPTQFGPNEDFAKYPRTEKQDCEMLEKAGCNAVFLPSVKEIYGTNAKTENNKIRNSDILCGTFRPGHFQGVVQVVGKLFDIVKPNIAVFGEKDFQQLWILKDNFRNVNIIGAPIIREKDGLAMSSRNKYLNESERKIAGKLNVILKNTLAKIKQGEIETSIEQAKKALLDSRFTKIDYIELRNEDNLEPIKTVDNKTRIFAAVWLGKTRLIDNMKMSS